MFPDKKQSANWLNRYRSRISAYLPNRQNRRQPSAKLAFRSSAIASPSGGRFTLWSGLAVAALSVGLSFAGGWQLLELQSYNLIHRTRRSLVGTPSWDNRIVVIAIDDASISELGQFPWPRQTHAQLLEQLWSTQPAAVSFDLLFPDTTPDDGDLSAAIVNSANVVLAVAGGRTLVAPTIAEGAAGFFLAGDISNPTDIDGISRSIRLYNDETPSFGVATLQVYAETMRSTTQASGQTSGQTSGQALNTANLDAFPLDRARITIPDVDNPDASAIAVDENSPTDGSRRHHKGHSPSVYDLASQPEPSPSAPAVDHSSPPLGRISSQSREFAAALVDRISDRIPDDTTLWISWPGEAGLLPDPDFASKPEQPQIYAYPDGPGHLKVYSYADVLKGRVDNSYFQNKIVIVGATAAGLDPLRTPFQPFQANSPTSGVYLHAAIIDNLLNQSFLKRPPKWQRTLLLAILAIASTHLLQRQDVYRRLAVLVGFPLVWSGFAYGSFLLGWWLPVAAPLGTVALGGLVIQLREQQEKQQLMDIFSMSVSQGTAELIWQNKEVILHRGELAAQTLTATVLFMDIRGFTGIAEALPSHQLLPWLNQYFETMTDCIMERGGMVDKYIGDAIMAVFGAPLPRTSAAEVQADAIAAIQAAIEMHDRLKTLNCQLAEQDLPTIEFGIGIHTGLLTGGTVGSRHRLNYSVFGDTVNIAARLESMTKRLPPSAPYRLLISADTHQHTQSTFSVELFESGNLRGRQSSTDVYTLVEANPAVPVEVAVSDIAQRQGAIATQKIAV